MSLRTVQHTMIGGLLLGVASAALAQVPVPVPVPLPGLEVRIAAGRPPAPRHERRPKRPGANYLWVGGFWNWQGARWGWIPGRWEIRATPDVYWIPARYVRVRHGYIYEPGHWSNETIIVNDDIRRRDEWRRHERQHERELERERHGHRD